LLVTDGSNGNMPEEAGLYKKIRGCTHVKVWTKKMTESNIKGPIIYNKVLKRIATGRSPAAKYS